MQKIRIKVAPYIRRAGRDADAMRAAGAVSVRALTEPDQLYNRFYA